MVIPNSSPPSKVPLERDEYGNPRFHGCSNIREFEFLGKLGEGTFGEVYKARSKRSGAIVALKKILMHNEKDGFPITALREIKLLKMLSHPNVLQLQEMAVERPRGLLENPSVHFTEPQIKCYMLQLLEGLRLQISVWLDHMTNRHPNLAKEAVKQPPELLLHLRKYTTAIDMWGVGCVFGEMFKGKPILAGSSDINQAHLIFSLVGTPTEENMPGWSSLPGCDVVKNFGSKEQELYLS
ncbi:hypothetical protein HCAG_03109 [Histoplasma mississippiense (nom. inval.)]|uniref:hypothetical protein n=1 Tax=Ajellomyces capsulatus (strain NAm1 / WU24) TaxID=2059318 RepID=UPI000157BF97|nr:hypothetical protein HCAG_03109 [Histoplasma mississippiense (nom. inval.)]EDN06506.1 hypothetical protein HCAG_03109 [Histoplasma mississippiense (nom. inval.)]